MLTNLRRQEHAYRVFAWALLNNPSSQVPSGNVGKNQSANRLHLASILTLH